MACHACVRRLRRQDRAAGAARAAAAAGGPQGPAAPACPAAGRGVGGQDALLGGVGTQVLELMMVLTSRRQTSGGSWHHTNIGGGVRYSHGKVPSNFWELACHSSEVGAIFGDRARREETPFDIGMICIWDMTQCAKPPPSSDFWTSRRLDVTHLTLSDSSCSRKQSRGLTDGLHHPFAPPHCHNSSRPACTPTVNLAGFDVQMSDVLDIVASDADRSEGAATSTPPTHPPTRACVHTLPQ